MVLLLQLVMVALLRVDQVVVLQVTMGALREGMAMGTMAGTGIQAAEDQAAEGQAVGGQVVHLAHTAMGALLRTAVARKHNGFSESVIVGAWLFYRLV
jgi:hypothetical protein